MAGKKPNIRRQDQIRQDSIETYKNPDTGAEVSSKTVRTHKTDRAIQKRRDNDNVKNMSLKWNVLKELKDSLLGSPTQKIESKSLNVSIGSNLSADDMRLRIEELEGEVGHISLDNTMSLGFDNDDYADYKEVIIKGNK